MRRIITEAKFRSLAALGGVSRDRAEAAAEASLHFDGAVAEFVAILG